MQPESVFSHANSDGYNRSDSKRHGYTTLVHVLALTLALTSGMHHGAIFISNFDCSPLRLMSLLCL
jgi:hypothetical protein